VNLLQSDSEYFSAISEINLSLDYFCFVLLI